MHSHPESTQSGQAASHRPRAGLTRPSPVRPGPSALAAAAAILTAAGCGGGGGGGGNQMNIVEVGNGFGPLLPHTAYRLDASGNPTTQVMALRTLADIYNNVNSSNPVLPVVTWDTQARLPDGSPGNHFLVARFTQPIDVASVLLPNTGGSVSSNLTGAITVVALDPLTGESTNVRGRAFVNGQTYGAINPSTGQFELESWIGLAQGANGQEKPVALVPEALGFPGTQSPSGFNGANLLVGENTLVFVVDNDNDLTTHETFPTGRQIRARFTKGIESTGGRELQFEGLACSTVGVDELSPEVRVLPSEPTSLPAINPGNGQEDVDPAAPVRIEFSEPVDPASIGSLPTGAPPLTSSAVSITFGPAGGVTNVFFTVSPASPYDLTVMELQPTFVLPGTGPASFACDTYSRVTVRVASQQIRDFKTNLNSQSVETFFVTGEGKPVTNAPVAPEAIVLGRAGSVPGLSVIDLNGFGGSTGNPTYDPFNPIVKGNSNYPNNPNLVNQGGLIFPPIKEGTCTLDGGSSGVFTLTKNSALQDKLLAAPDILSIEDMMIGQPLDLAFNNGPSPFGCQSGNPNVCASSGLKIVSPFQVGPHSLGPAPPGQIGTTQPGTGNIISWAPHPNPPPLIFPPLCISPDINGQEPTSVDSANPNNQPGLPQLQNLLVPNGNPFGNPQFNLPPNGLLAVEQNCYFRGPSRPQTTPSSCQQYMIRQQVGHFLYVLDAVRGEIVVVNSNRFTVLDRIVVSDPTALAMSPNLDLLAVTSRIGGQVSFIDINPSSSTFHQIVKVTAVGKGPSGIAWQPDNEDIMVCNELDNSMSVISAFDLEVRKTLKAELDFPFEVSIGNRQVPGLGLARNVYFAFILNRNGRVSLFESGPDGAGGWGYDQVLGQTPFVFPSPKAMQLNQLFLQGGVWVVHENKLNAITGQPTGQIGGAVSELIMESGITGQLPIVPVFAGSFLNARQIDFRIRSSIGSEVLTGVPVDLCFDDMTNLGGLPAFQGQFAAGIAAQANGKQMVRATVFGSQWVSTNGPNYMFLAIPNSNQAGGVVDVVDLLGGLKRVDTDVFVPGVQSIPATGVNVLCEYYRQ